MNGISEYRDCLGKQLDRLAKIEPQGANEAALISHAVCEVMNTLLRLSTSDGARRPLPEEAVPYSPPEKQTGQNLKLTMTPDEAAALLGKGAMAIRIGLRNGTFPWGYAVLNKGGRWTYIISREKFSRETGIYFDSDGKAYSECGRI